MANVPPASDTSPHPRTKFASRRSFRAVVVVLAVLGAIWWYLNSPAAVRVADAEVSPNNGITAFVNSCGGELTVDIYEDDSLVIIEVLDHRFRIRPYGNDCQDGIHIPLSVPLGGRLLIDGSADRQVPVNR